MAGVELRLGIAIRQPMGKFWEFVFAFMIVEQVESSHDGIHWEWTCCKDIFQTAMGTTREEQTACI